MIILHCLRKKVLLLSGDIELNPGPIVKNNVLVHQRLSIYDKKKNNNKKVYL